MLNALNTIAAISTAVGNGGIGVVRISGELSLKIGEGISGSKLIPRVANFHNFKDSQDNLIDQGLILFFPAPNSFTGEDIIEFHCHGGTVVTQSILEICLEMGADLAEPGDFTKRAYLNNKIDLTQAESVADLINASTAEAVKSAANSLSGKFSIEINNLLKNLIELRMYVEACLDFPEEDIDFISEGKVKDKLKKLSKIMTNIMHSASQGQLLRDGISLVLVGQPNVGKSSLLNQLSGEDKAIVTEIPGTTRDLISSNISLNGIPLNIIDTAGLRKTDDPIEKFGIEKTWSSLEKGHIALFLVEAASGITEYERSILKKLPKDIKKIWIFNKIDLIKEKAQITTDNNEKIVYLSAKTGDGLDLLKQVILNSIGFDNNEGNQNKFMARKRHLEALEKVFKSLKNAESNIDSAELVAEELTISQRYLSSITGEFTSDDLLGEIFSKFCIGK
ncbi:MAG: tRNA uridine-5-carboxymethylaminomethyl(34) synthesis GTPase MnmE [Nitrosomonadales bacterium]|nr:tRNA uridine-5-carboxymethylaminomethyl(34) synthesis GTPase MnmE [Nitrosomonadales bacterium]|tara:strand:+ start:489 stop:1838 length:1350 start_codon:yes stop_codon:yes gene_type:complete